MPAKVENISDFTAEQIENYVYGIFKNLLFGKYVVYFQQKTFNKIFHLYFYIVNSN